MRTIHEAIAVSERDVLPCPCCGHGACDGENACTPHARTPRRAALRWLAAVFGTLLLVLGFAAGHARADEKLPGDSIYQLDRPVVVTTIHTRLVAGPSPRRVRATGSAISLRDQRASR